MFNIVLVLITALTWAATASRYSAVRRQPGRMAPLALFLTLAALAAGWTLRVPLVETFLNNWADAVNFTLLLANGCVLAAGTGTQAMLLSLTHDESSARRMMRPRLLALSTSLFVMALVTVAYRPSPQSENFIDDYIPTLYYVAYSIPYLAFLAYIFVGITRLCWRYARQSSELPHLRAGLQLIAAGGAVGLVYVSGRVVYLIAARFQASGELAQVYEAASSQVALVLTLLVTLGATLPSLAPRLGAFRDMRELYPLWQAMLRVFPEVGQAQGRGAAPSPLADMLPLRRVRFRRTRRVVEIRDGEFNLRRNLRAGVRERVRSLALQNGLHGAELEATVEAAQLAVALHEQGTDPRRADMADADHDAMAPISGGADLDSEITWLRRIARAFQKSPVVVEAVTQESKRSGLPPPDNPRTRMLAHVVAEVSAPAPVLVVLLLAAGAGSSANRVAGLGWGAVAAVFFGVIPYAGIRWAMWRGRLSDHHISDRKQRPLVMMLSLCSFATGFALLNWAPWWGGGPVELVLVAGALLSAGVVCLLITLRWKISMHTGVAGCAAALLLLIYGPWLLLAWPTLVLVAWARVRLRAHTPAQVMTGALVGAAISAAVFIAAR